jgi:3-deoxy-D-manno-octulosonic-acid transferase
MALALQLYRALSHSLAPAARPWLEARVRAGKEDGARLEERFGAATAPRPDGRLVWLHAASVGELGVALTLRADLPAGANALITTGTRTSAELFAKRAPHATVHQYAPLDTPGAIGRFLDHWRPDLGVFIESEIWPNLIMSAKARGVRLALMNARMNGASLRRWRGMKSSAQRLFGAFDVILPADATTSAGLAAILERPLPAPGNLKLSASAPGADAGELARLKTMIGARPLWLAASTHPGEDEICLTAHALLRGAFPDALLIIAPRHPERGETVAALVRAKRRSLGDAPGSDDPVFVADTIGEMGLWLRLAAPALIAGSLLADLKGHNPIEAARLNVPILSGPHVASFADIYAAFDAAGGVAWTKDAAAIATKIEAIWRAPDIGAGLAAAAAKAAEAGQDARIRAQEKLRALLETT